MNRQIKFRFWFPAQNRMVNGEEGFISLNGEVFAATRPNLFPPNDRAMIRVDEFGPFKDIVLQQFTGLKDTEGKEIYEGDIMKHPHKDPFRIIEWMSEDDGFDWTGWVARGSSHGEGIYGKVVGNIFENQELLKL